MQEPLQEVKIEDVVGVVEGTDINQTEDNVIPESGIVVGASPEQIKEEEAETNVGFELGDLVVFHSARADIETVKGRIYYIDESRISILESGKTQRIVVFDLEKDEEGDYQFKEEYELTGAEIEEKRMMPSFVAQQGLAKDMDVETFTADGEPLAKYKIETVNEIEDSAVFVDEAGEKLELSFEYKGIPRDRSDIPFDVLRMVEPPKKEETVPNEAVPGEVEEELDFEFLDDMEAPDVEPVMGLFQASAKPIWQQNFSDDDQVNSMLRERIQELDPAAQRSTSRIREVTRLVWNMLSLRNEVTRYSGDKPVGRKPVSFNTLVELLEKSEFPLAKKVLSIAKAIYVDHSNEDLRAYLIGNQKDPTTLSDPQILLNYLQDIIIKGNRYIDAQLGEGLAPQEVQLGLVKKIPRWITIWQGFFNKYFVTMNPIREDDELKDITYDQDFFRFQIPTDEGEEYTLTGFRELYSDRDTIVRASDLGKVRYSLMRALGPRYGRYGEGGLTHKVEDADQAEIKGYLIFPLDFIRDLGYIRSGILAWDVANALTRSKTMDMILQKAGSIVDIPEQGKIISVNFDGSTLGNVTLADWLKGQAIYGGGMGDVMPYLRSYGLLQSEITMPQKLVLDKKINTYRNAVKKMLYDFRVEIINERKTRPQLKTYPLLESQRSFEMIQRLTKPGVGEPILEALIKDFKARFHFYQFYDVGIFAYLYHYYPDFLLNALAQNPEVAKERLRAERDIYIQEIVNTLEAEKKIQDKGEPPQPNPCQHVKDLNKIRKVSNNTERMLLFNKFVRLYNLKKEDHWLWCNNGEPPHHLICEHEYLLLQEFLRPKEKEILHKEIILVFGGGKFNGQYICRQCGQPIADYEYDTHLEYSDEGVPMSGRAVLVDQDAIEEEKLQQFLITEDEEDEEKGRVETTSEDDLTIYNTINEIANLVGVFPERQDYLKMITQVKNALLGVPDRVKYAQSQKALKKAGRVSTDYDIFYNRILVSLCGAALLIDVQTHIPEYVIRYTLPGCANPSFVGYPKDKDIRKPDTGMEYIACAISSITKRTKPWDITGYQSIASSTERLREILTYLKTFTEQLAETPEVDQALRDKKQYLIETFGYESALGRPKDMIPFGFRPVQFIATEELAREAEAPVVVESASEEEKIRAFIKQAHIYALKYGKYTQGVSFSESACCYGNLMNPAEFWMTKGNMPEISSKEPPRGTKGSVLHVHMTPRPLERIFGQSDASIMYRLFLRVCFKGPRVGKQHEPGYDNKCAWCELQFPEDPRNPPPTRRFAKDGSKQKKYDEEYENALQEKETMELQALKNAGIEEVTKENFEKLLIDVNRNSLIPIADPPSAPSSMDNLRGMLSILPSPFEDYEETLRNLLVGLEALPKDASRKEIINAFAGLSTKAVALESELQTRLGDSIFGNYQKMLELNPAELGEALRTYFLVPLQRVLTRVQDNAPILRSLRRRRKKEEEQQDTSRKFKPVVRPSKTQEFSEDVLEDLQEAYRRHTFYLNEIIRDIPKDDKFIKAKIKEAVDRLSVVIPVFIKILRPTVVRGGALASTFLQRCIVAGIFAEFIMPNHVPSNNLSIIAPTSSISIPAKLPAKILGACVLKYRQEGLNYSQDQIREMIQDRIEKEKSLFIKEKNDMTPEQRKLDNLLQRYGMGKWAVGGKNVIWRLDKDHYITEKEQMEAAGITRFGPDIDVYREAEEGYPVEQTDPDDA